MREIFISDSADFRANETLNRYFGELRTIPPLSPQEEFKIALNAQRGDERAKLKLITSNLLFVVSVAKKYRGMGVPLQDLVEEGNMGLIKAVDKFDPKKGFKFITYAVWWIRESIIRSLNKDSRIIRVPRGTAELNWKIVSAIEKYRQADGDYPTIDQLSRSLNVAKPVIQETLNAIASINSIDSEEFSSESQYDLWVSKGSTNNYLKTIATEAFTADLNHCCEQVLTLSETEVIKATYGIEQSREKGLTELAPEMQLSKERIRQLRESALQKLRKPEPSKVLKFYLG